jgi:hypothetical protein
VPGNNERSFNTFYGDYIYAAFPNVEIEVIPSEGAMDYSLPQEERLGKWCEEGRSIKSMFETLNDVIAAHFA